MSLQCPRCFKRVVHAVTRDGEELELVQHTETQLYGLKAAGVDTPAGRRYTQTAFKAQAYVEHECAKIPDTIGAPGREATITEFPSLGDPAKVVNGKEER